ASGATHSISEDLSGATDFAFTSASCTGGSDSNGTLNGTTISGIDARSDDNITCTFTNTQKPAPQLKIVKSCPSGAAATSDRFQPKNNGSATGLSELACGGDETITLTPDTAYDITEGAGSSGSLSSYDNSYSTNCANASGWPRGTALKTCTIT